MALPPNAQPVPNNPPVDPAAAAEKERQKKIKNKRTAEDTKLNATNSVARAKAIAKKGSQTYNYQEIQGNPDFGIGAAGPGTPYSVKSTKLPEKQKSPTKPRSTPVGKLPGWVKGTPLWPVTGNMSAPQSTDWKQAAIRRRLSNG